LCFWRLQACAPSIIADWPCHHVMFRYWWPTNDNSAERQRIVFAVKRGPLAGKAVAIINNAGPACQDQTPLARAAAGER